MVTEYQQRVAGLCPDRGLVFVAQGPQQTLEDPVILHADLTQCCGILVIVVHLLNTVLNTHEKGLDLKASNLQGFQMKHKSIIKYILMVVK